MAAVWKLWKNPKTQLWEPTFAILTGEPNGKFAEIHERMTFLEPRDYEEYLGLRNVLLSISCEFFRPRR